jgi:hypothetical protein
METAGLRPATVRNQIGNPMRAARLSLHPEHAVSMSTDCALPEPALVIVTKAELATETLKILGRHAASSLKP